MLNMISTVIVAKKTLATGLAAGVMLGGAVAAEASGLTSALSGHLTADSYVAADAQTDTAIETLAASNAHAQADTGLQTAVGAITNTHASMDTDAQAHVTADVDGSASIGKQVSAEARSRVSAMAEFVLDLLGINVDPRSDTTAGATVAIDADVKSTPGLETAIEAAVSAGVSEQAETVISTALKAIGDAQTGMQAQIGGLSTAVAAGANVAADGELDASSPSGVAAGGSAHGSGNLGIGLAIGQ